MQMLYWGSSSSLEIFILEASYDLDTLKGSRLTSGTAGHITYQYGVALNEKFWRFTFLANTYSQANYIIDRLRTNSTVRVYDSTNLMDITCRPIGRPSARAIKTASGSAKWEVIWEALEEGA